MNSDKYCFFWPKINVSFKESRIHWIILRICCVLFSFLYDNQPTQRMNNIVLHTWMNQLLLFRTRIHIYIHMNLHDNTLSLFKLFLNIHIHTHLSHAHTHALLSWWYPLNTHTVFLWGCCDFCTFACVCKFIFLYLFARDNHTILLYSALLLVT